MLVPLELVQFTCRSLPNSSYPGEEDVPYVQVSVSEPELIPSTVANPRNVPFAFHAGLPTKVVGVEPMEKV